MASDRALSRRTFLGATAGLLVAGACGGGAKQAVTTTSTTAASSPLNLVLGSFQVLAGSEQRVAFGVLDGQKPVGPNTDVEIAFSQDGPGGDFNEAIRRAEGIDARPLHVVTHTFATPGIYTATARAGGRTAEAAVQVVDPATSKVPVPGQPLPSVATPTTADSRGVDPICTREPDCPWHDISLDAALAEAKPIVLLVATPALCQSAVCGPVLDMLLDVEDEFGDRLRFIHAEVFTDASGSATTPIVQALQLENEPFLFLAGADGKVVERFDGPYDREEARLALTRLAGG